MKCDYCKQKEAKRTYCSRECANKASGEKRKLANIDSYKLTCNICHLPKASSLFSFIIRGDVTSGKKQYCKRCGANKRERRRREKTWQDDARQVLLNNSKQRARRANMEHNLEIEDIIIPEFCPVLGIKLAQEKRDSKYSGPSIDRIDNTKGYTKDNIVIVSCRANLLKKDATIQELIRLAKYYANFLP